MFCIVLDDRPHGSCKRSACKHTFLKPGLRVTPSPHPSTSSLQPLNPAMSHHNNNNIGGLHACVRSAEDIEPIRVTRTKYSAPLPLRYAKEDYGHPTSHFRLLLVLFGFSFYCLFVYSAQVLCACFISSSPFLVNFKCHLLAWNMNYSVLSHFQWIYLDTNILETMPRKMGKKRSFWYVWTWPQNVAPFTLPFEGGDPASGGSIRGTALEN